MPNKKKEEKKFIQKNWMKKNPFLFWSCKQREKKAEIKNCPNNIELLFFQESSSTQNTLLSNIDNIR